MKTKLFASILSLAIIMASCSRSNDSVPSNLAQVTAQSATAGTWRISSFTDNGTNATADFSGYRLISL